MTPLYIFDLDGTLALIEHRRHLVERPSLKCCTCWGKNSQNCPDCSDLDAGWKPNWSAFFAACVDDEPNWPVIQTLKTLQDSGAEIWIWSGRSSEVMAETNRWIGNYLCGAGEESDTKLMMRLEGDFTPDEQLKAGWLDDMSAFDRRRLVAVFDDRQKVVDMWRSKGVACFQVAPGDF